jgi:type II secretory pathway pseudopilin PulG
LVELLVVIAIIGMLISLLLPAVNAAREAGRRTTCQNNIRNVALALKNYDSIRGTVPAIANFKISQADPTLNLSRPLLYEILPQLERNDLYEANSRERVLDHIPPTLGAVSDGLPQRPAASRPGDGIRLQLRLRDGRGLTQQ